jgi:hypothetical protein
MNVVLAPKIVVLGMMSRMPVAGVVWQTVHYLIGLKRLGYDVYYVEAHGTTPRSFLRRPEDNGWANAAAFIDRVLKRFDLGHQWAYFARYGDGRYYGMSETQVNDLYRSAALIINLHGGTDPLPEHSANGRLVYLETDPVAAQIEVHHQEKRTLDYLSTHCAFFTFGENYGQLDCGLPVSNQFAFKATRQPVVVDFWHNVPRNGGEPVFTTIGNWQQPAHVVTYEGEVYHWSKHLEFLKFIDLPARTSQAFELALSNYTDADKAMLESNGWRVRHALDFSMDLDRYCEYIAGSRGEFTVAKDQNIRLRSGWFSDRSACYLAMGRPVITQETGFSNILPTGAGLFAFTTMEEILDALEQINSEYERHSQAALQIARDYFSYDVVLPRLLAEVGL